MHIRATLDGDEQMFRVQENVSDSCCWFHDTLLFESYSFNKMLCLPSFVWNK